MKKILPAFVLLLISLSGHAQNFYQIDWASSGTNYSAFVVWHSDDDAYARVGYLSKAGVYQVAEFSCTGSTFYSEDGSEHYLIDGDAATVVRGDKARGYNADNFIFSNIDESNHFEDLFTIDDSQIETAVDEDLREATFTVLDANKFTEAYIKRYFTAADPQYNLFLNRSSKPEPKPVENKAATKMHLVLVANSLDVSIGPGCEVDSRKLKTEFNNIAEALGIGFESHVITGNAFKKESVLNSLNALQPGKDDIVVFFYRGHGFRWSGQEGAWPEMSMRYSSFQPLESIAIIDVYTAIKAKGARLNLVFGDMCNNDIGISQPVPNAFSAMQSNLYPSTEKLERLFLDAKGSIISVAAKPGEVSWVSNSDGGLYTSSFFEGLYKEVGKYSGTGDWNALIDYTIDRALYKSTKSCSNCTAQHGIKNVSIQYE